MSVRAFVGAFAIAAIAVSSSSPSALAAKAPQTIATPTGSAKQTSLQRIQRVVARLDAEASTPEGEADVVQRLSTQLRVPPQTLQQQKNDWGLGYGEVAMVYGFARAGRPQVVPEKVVEMRKSGMEWQTIARQLGVKVDVVATRMKRHGGKAATPNPAAGATQAKAGK
jgi:hypothetical protein